MQMARLVLLMQRAAHEDVGQPIGEGPDGRIRRAPGRRFERTRPQLAHRLAVTMTTAEHPEGKPPEGRPGETRHRHAERRAAGEAAMHVLHASHLGIAARRT